MQVERLVKCSMRAVRTTGDGDGGGREGLAHEIWRSACARRGERVGKRLVDAFGCLMIGVGREGGVAAGQLDELTYADALMVAFTGEVKSGRVDRKLVTST